MFRAEFNSEKDERMKVILNYGGFGWLKAESGKCGVQRDHKRSVFRAEFNNEREDRMRELVNYAGLGLLRDS